MKGEQISPSFPGHWWIHKHSASSLCWLPLWHSPGKATPRERTLEVAQWKKNHNKKKIKKPKIPIQPNQKAHPTTWTFPAWAVSVSQSIQQPPKGSANVPGEVVAEGQEGAAGEQQVQHWGFSLKQGSFPLPAPPGTAFLMQTARGSCRRLMPHTEGLMDWFW